MRMSAPVSLDPHKYPPPLGADLTWLSRKVKLLAKFGFRYKESTLPAIALTIGLIKKGDFVLRATEHFSVRPFRGEDFEAEKLTLEQHGGDEIRHQGAFRIMHEVSVPQPLLCLSLNLVFFAFLPPFRDKRGAEMVKEVLGDDS